MILDDHIPDLIGANFPKLVHLLRNGNLSRPVREALARELLVGVSNILVGAAQRAAIGMEEIETECMEFHHERMTTMILN